MIVEILPPGGEMTTHHLQKRRTGRVRTPLQMRVGNIHEPQAGIDVTKVLTARQTQPLRPR